MMYAEAGGRGGRRPDSFLLLWPVAHQGMHAVGGWEGGPTPETLMENKTSNKSRPFSLFSFPLFNLNENKIKREPRWLVCFGSPKIILYGMFLKAMFESERLKSGL